jgi:hypothetical protein
MVSFTYYVMSVLWRGDSRYPISYEYGEAASLPLHSHTSQGELQGGYESTDALRYEPYYADSDIGVIQQV